MKNLFFLALVACLGFIACDTPSPATTNPEDSTGTQQSTQPSTMDTTSSPTRTDTSRSN
jgi:hypothetical protein